jgi:protein-S-isoprenylcysteine O-methyltransferase Ste14
MLVLLAFLGWMACIVYSTIPAFWLMIHPRVEYWRSRRTSPYLVLIPVWMAMWAVMLVVTWPFKNLYLYSNPWAWLPAAALFALGLWIYRQAGAEMSLKQLGGVPELQAGHHEQRLITSGIRQHVRHPVYLGHLLEMLAWSVGTGLAVCFGLTAFAILTGAIMIHAEDVELEHRFGAIYANYKAAVPAVIPWPATYNQNFTDS